MSRARQPKVIHWFTPELRRASQFFDRKMRRYWRGKRRAGIGRVNCERCFSGTVSVVRGSRGGPYRSCNQQEATRRRGGRPRLQPPVVRSIEPCLRLLQRGLSCGERAPGCFQPGRSSARCRIASRRAFARIVTIRSCQGATTPADQPLRPRSGPLQPSSVDWNAG